MKVWSTGRQSSSPVPGVWDRSLAVSPALSLRVLLGNGAGSPILAPILQPQKTNQAGEVTANAATASLSLHVC